MNKVLIIAEHHHGHLAPSTKATLGAAEKLSTKSDVLLLCEKYIIGNFDVLLNIISNIISTQEFFFFHNKKLNFNI